MCCLRKRAPTHGDAMLKTYNQLYISARHALQEAGIEACTLEARCLVAHAAGKTVEKLLMDLQLYTSPEIEQKVEEYLRRRLSGEPVAYITGSWSFYGLDLKVTPDVLIPRFDTEVLVDKALELAGSRQSDARILDLCTGSGCIGCALGRSLPKSHVVLVDKSAKALAVAKENTRDLGLGTRAVCMELDVLDTPPAALGSFDMIVSNPPYIAASEIETLDVSVKDFEPRMALDGGADGLDFYRAILQNWTGLLRSGGWLLFEVGETQANDVMTLMERACLREIGMEEDTAGYARVVFGRK